MTTAPPDTAMTHMRELAAALTASGLQVRADERRAALTAANPAASAAGGPRGTILGPGLSQAVALRTGGDGKAGWYWLWVGPERGSAPELEYLCPAEAVATAASRINRVLRTQPDTAD